MDILKTIFERQYQLNKRILKDRHNQDYDKLCDHNLQNSELDKLRIEWILNYNRAQIHESIELKIHYRGNGGKINQILTGKILELNLLMNFTFGSVNVKSQVWMLINYLIFIRKKTN